jgi:hypothetical protein
MNRLKEAISLISQKSCLGEWFPYKLRELGDKSIVYRITEIDGIPEGGNMVYSMDLKVDDQTLTVETLDGWQEFIYGPEGEGDYEEHLGKDFLFEGPIMIMLDYFRNCGYSEEQINSWVALEDYEAKNGQLVPWED